MVVTKKLPPDFSGGNLMEPGQALTLHTQVTGCRGNIFRAVHFNQSAYICVEVDKT